MNANIWQYLVLLEGVGAIFTAIGVAHEILRRNSSNLVGYANVGVALISVSACASIGVNVTSSPNLATWVAAAGFALYAVGIVGTWIRTAAGRFFPGGGQRASAA